MMNIQQQRGSDLDVGGKREKAGKEVESAVKLKESSSCALGGHISSANFK